MAADERPAIENGSRIPAGSHLEFHYTALSFLFPERVRFRFMLEGFDREWVDAGARRVAYYTNLPPGSYRFRVAASNGDGIWSEPGASFALELSPRFYQTIWFYLLCAATVVLAGLGVHRLAGARIAPAREATCRTRGGAHVGASPGSG